MVEQVGFTVRWIMEVIMQFILVFHPGPAAISATHVSLYVRDTNPSVMGIIMIYNYGRGKSMSWTLGAPKSQSHGEKKA